MYHTMTLCPIPYNREDREDISYLQIFKSFQNNTSENYLPYNHLIGGELCQ